MSHASRNPRSYAAEHFRTTCGVLDAPLEAMLDTLPGSCWTSLRIPRHKYELDDYLLGKFYFIMICRRNACTPKTQQRSLRIRCARVWLPSRIWYLRVLAVPFSRMPWNEIKPKPKRLFFFTLSFRIERAYESLTCLTLSCTPSPSLCCPVPLPMVALNNTNI